MIVSTLGIEVSPENRREALNVIASTMGRTRTLSGCVSCDLYQHEGEPLKLMLIERWESLAALKDHIRSDDFRRVLAWLDMSCAQPDVRFESVSEIQGLELIEILRTS